MKRFLFAVLMLVVFGVPSWATVVYDQDLVNVSTSTDASFAISCYSKNIDKLSFQAVYSSVTFVGVSVTTSNINTTTDVITTTQAFSTGFSVFVTSAAFTGGGLANGTTYFAIYKSATGIQLATTKALAIAGTAIDLTTGTVAGAYSGSFILTPINISAASPFSFKWQTSNEVVPTNWTDLSVTSITISGTTGQTTAIWDFATYTYRNIRAVLTSGTFGAINLKLRGYGKTTNP